VFSIRDGNARGGDKERRTKVRYIGRGGVVEEGSRGGGRGFDQGRWDPIERRGKPRWRYGDKG